MPAPARFARALAIAALAVLVGATADAASAASLPAERPPTVPVVLPSVAVLAPGSPAERARGERVAGLARRHVGAPYRWGGATPAGFDCSGFVAFLYAEVGVRLPRDSQGQAAAGRRIAADAMLPGDVLTFGDTYRSGPSHVGVYLGDGRFAHAADEHHGVTTSALGDDYWGPRFLGAVRPGG